MHLCSLQIRADCFGFDPGDGGEGILQFLNSFRGRVDGDRDDIALFLRIGKSHTADDFIAVVVQDGIECGCSFPVFRLIVPF